MPSSIEMMIDQAGGYTEPAKRNQTPDNLPDLLLAVADAAEEFYKVRVSIPRHSLNSTDRKLFDAVQAWLEAGGGKGSK